MSAEDNKRLLKALVEEVWNEGNLQKIEEYVAEDCLEHNPYGDVEGIEGHRQFVMAIHDTYDDFRLIAHNIVADDDFVSYNFTVEGKHTGSVGEVRPTNKNVEVDGVYLARIESGKIVEAWNHFDTMSLLDQLGQLPESSFVGTRVKQVSPQQEGQQEERPEHRPRA